MKFYYERRVAPSQSQLLGFLPCVLRVAKVAVCRRLAVNRLLEVKLLHDNTRPKIPVLADNLDKLQVRLLARAVSIDEDRQGLGYANGVRELDERTAS